MTPRLQAFLALLADRAVLATTQLVRHSLVDRQQQPVERQSAAVVRVRKGYVYERALAKNDGSSMDWLSLVRFSSSAWRFGSQLLAGPFGGWIPGCLPVSYPAHSPSPVRNQQTARGEHTGVKGGWGNRQARKVTQNPRAGRESKRRRRGPVDYVALNKKLKEEEEEQKRKAH